MFTEVAETEAKNDIGAEEKGEETKAEETKTEEKAEETKTEETKEEKGPEGAPENYEPFKLPEGKQADEVLLGEFTDVCKELNLTQDNAQKLVDFLAKSEAKTSQDLIALLDKRDADWEKELKADKEFGGAAYEESTEGAKRAVLKYDKVLGGKLIPLLEEQRLRGNPVLKKLFLHLDKTLGEDKIVDGDPGSKERKSLEERLLPEHGKKK